MKTFKNTSFKQRDYECTNIVFCQAETMPAGAWEECKEIEIARKNCNPLWIQGGVQYFGWL